MVNNISKNNLDQQGEPLQKTEIKQEDVKALSVWKRIFKSPTIAYVANTITIIGLVVTILTLPVGVTLIISSIALVILTLLQFACIWKQRKLLGFEISLGYNLIVNDRRMSKRKWYNKIEDNLYLGAIPLKNKNHHEILPKQLKIETVISIVEKFENHNVVLTSDPVSPKDWETLKVHQQQIFAEDHQPLSTEMLHQCADAIHRELSNGKTIYVHCKAGRSRSAAAIAAYYIKYRNEKDLGAIICKIKKCRPQIDLGGKKYESLKIFSQHCLHK